MDVIRGSADRERPDLILFRDPAKVWPEAVA